MPKYTTKKDNSESKLPNELIIINSHLERTSPFYSMDNLKRGCPCSELSLHSTQDSLREEEEKLVDDL